MSSRARGAVFKVRGPHPPVELRGEANSKKMVKGTVINLDFFLWGRPAVATFLEVYFIKFIIFSTKVRGPCPLPLRGACQVNSKVKSDCSTPCKCLFCTPGPLCSETIAGYELRGSKWRRSAKCKLIKVIAVVIFTLATTNLKLQYPLKLLHSKISDTMVLHPLYLRPCNLFLSSNSLHGIIHLGYPCTGQVSEQGKKSNAALETLFLGIFSEFGNFFNFPKVISLVFTKSVDTKIGAFSGSRNIGISLAIHCFGTRLKMTSRFAKTKF